MARSLIERLKDQQNALAEFGSYAFRARDLSEILDRAAKICGRTIGALCGICRHRVDHNDLMFEAGYGWQPNIIGTTTIKIDSSSPGGRAFLTRKSVISGDLREADFVLPPLYQQHGILSTATVIIAGQNGDAPYGILELDSIKSKAYDEAVIDFLTGFANVLAEAVDTVQRRITLEKAVAEKEMLSRELQHRVRNNLHLINSMLEMEVMSGDASPDRFQDIANRVRALATMYDHLLGTGLGKSLALDQYLTKLCDTLRPLQPAKVELYQQPMPNISVDLDTATILGIVVTEIITNSFKHAFPDGSGTVELALEAEPVPKIRVVDNGIGIDIAQSSKRYGMGLVRRLIEQIQGSLEIRTENGTLCEIVLPR